MTNSYDPNRDVLDTVTPFHRPFSPARDAQTVTPSDTDDLQLYGKLYVFNGGASAEVIRVVPVEYTEPAGPDGRPSELWAPELANRRTNAGTDWLI